MHIRIRTSERSDTLSISPKLAEDYIKTLDDAESNSARFVQTKRAEWEDAILRFFSARKTESLDYLSEAEGVYCQRLLESLGSEQWIQPLVDRIRKEGISRRTKPLLFELRFAAELIRLGLPATYEYDAGNRGTIDFRIEDDCEWLVELVRIEESDAVKSAIRRNGPFWEACLGWHGKDKHQTEDDELTQAQSKQTEEDELIRVQSKIGEKVFSAGRTIKFPKPSGGAFNIILADMRNHCLCGPDRLDFQEIAYGLKGLEPEERRWAAHYRKDADGNTQPILGIFERENPLLCSSAIQERIHIIAFSNEEEYGDGELLRQIYYVGNPLLFETTQAWSDVFKQMPFRPEVAC